MADSQIKLIDYQCQLINYYVIWGTHENPNRGEYDVNTEVLHINNPIKNHARWHKLCFSNLTQLIVRLNFGIKNRTFLCGHFFLFKKWNWFSSSRWFWRYQNFDPIPWEIDLKFLLGFWKCVGDNKTRGCYILEVTECVYLFTRVIFVCNIRGTYLIFPQPTQFQPP